MFDRDAVMGFMRGEECDDGNTNNTDSCVANCETAECGDGYTWNTDGGSEQCDDGQESAACNATCTTASCGDGVLNTTAGEACDAGEALRCRSAHLCMYRVPWPQVVVSLGFAQVDHYITYPGEVEKNCWRIEGDVCWSNRSRVSTAPIESTNCCGTNNVSSVTTQPG